MRHLAGLIFAVTAFILVFFCMPETGAIYTHDTQSYEYAASTFIESGQIKYFGYDTPIIQWPPFYILVLSIMKIFKISVAQGAAWLNAGLFAYLVYTCSLYLFENLKEKVLTIPALILLTLSVPLIFVSGYGWTEMLFIFLSVLSVVLMLMYIKRKKPSWLISSSIISSLCWLTRYMGIVVIASLAIVLFVSEKPFIERVKKTFSYSVFSFFPMAIWVFRNYILSGTFTGGRPPGTYTLNDNINLSLEVFGDWFSFLTPVFSYTAVGLFVFLAVTTFFLKKNNRKKKSQTAINILASILIIVLYSAVLLTVATKTAMDPLSSRHWSPVYPFLVFTVVFIMDALIKNIKAKRIKGWIASGFILFAVVMVINPLMWLDSEGFARKSALMGSKEDMWVKSSPVLALAQDTIEPSQDTLVISNAASILSMHSDLKCYYPPKKEGIPIYLFGRYSERIVNFNSIYLVWSGPIESESFMDVSQFSEIFNMEKIAQNNYCVIYRIK